MYDCWENNLYGGLKSVERQLGIRRGLTEIYGYEAVRLWQSYVNDNAKDALATLLENNKEDAINLKTLKEMLLYPFKSTTSLPKLELYYMGRRMRLTVVVCVKNNFPAVMFSTIQL